MIHEHEPSPDFIRRFPVLDLLGEGKNTIAVLLAFIKQAEETINQIAAIDAVQLGVINKGSKFQPIHSDKTIDYSIFVIPQNDAFYLGVFLADSFSLKEDAKSPLISEVIIETNSGNDAQTANILLHTLIQCIFLATLQSHKFITDAKSGAINEAKIAETFGEKLRIETEKAS